MASTRRQPAGSGRRYGNADKGAIMGITARVLACATALLASSALVAGSCTAALGASAATVKPGPWSQTDYNAAMSRANLGESTLTPATVSKIGYLRTLTSQPDPIEAGCSENAGYVAPNLAGGDIFALANGRLVKYQASDGHVLWQRTPDPTWSFSLFSVAVSGDVVIVGSEYCGSVSDPDGRIQAFSAATGKPLWSVPTTPGFGPMSSMVVADGLVIGSGSSAGGGTVVSAHLVSNGKLAWQQSYGSCNNTGSAVVVGGFVVFAACGDMTGTPFLQGDNLTTGARAWRQPGTWQVERGDLSASAGKNVFAVSGGTAFDVNPKTGATRYTLTGATNVLAVDASLVFADCSNFDICGYDLSDGSQAWQVSDNSQLAAEAGGVLYLADGQALTASTGAQLGFIWAGSALAASAIAVGEGRIAVVNDPRVLDIYGLPGS